MAVKDAEIKVRVTKEQKELIKRVAQASGMNMSEFIVATVEKLAKQKDESIKFKDVIEDRAVRTDKKLAEIKIKLSEVSERKKHEKKKFFKWK